MCVALLGLGQLNDIFNMGFERSLLGVTKEFFPSGTLHNFGSCKSDWR